MPEANISSPSADKSASQLAGIVEGGEPVGVHLVKVGAQLRGDLLLRHEGLGDPADAVPDRVHRTVEGLADHDAASLAVAGQSVEPGPDRRDRRARQQTLVVDCGLGGP